MKTLGFSWFWLPNQREYPWIPSPTKGSTLGLKAWPPGPPGAAIPPAQNSSMKYASFVYDFCKSRFDHVERYFAEAQRGQALKTGPGPKPGLGSSWPHLALSLNLSISSYTYTLFNISLVSLCSPHGFRTSLIYLSTLLRNCLLIILRVSLGYL